MPKVRGRREKRHQPFWDSLVRGNVGNFTFAGNAAALGATNTLFGIGAQPNLGLGNMESNGGQFPSDQTYRILALRVGLYFRACAGTVAGLALTDHIMYHHAEHCLFWELTVQGKTYFQAYTPYLPSGGGLFGDVGNDTTVYFVNGVPSQEAICKLARSIALPARQNFRVVNTIPALGGINFNAEVNGLTAGEVWIWFTIDGLHVRDIL